MSQIALLKNKRVAIVILVELNSQNGFQARSDWHLVRPLDASRYAPVLNLIAIAINLVIATR